MFSRQTTSFVRLDQQPFAQGVFASAAASVATSSVVGLNGRADFARPARKPARVPLMDARFWQSLPDDDDVDGGVF